MADTSRTARFARPHSTAFSVLLALFVATMLISNLTAIKPVVFWPELHLAWGWFRVDGILTDGAFYLFPLAYVLGDVISEVYGFRVMRRVIVIGFATLLLASFCFWITLALPGADFWTHQEALTAVIGPAPIMMLAGLAGYLVGEFLNSWVLVALKRRTGERRLWARLLGSTVVGELADTFIFCAIAASVLQLTTVSQYLNYAVLGFVWKTLVEILVMPVTYVVCARLKRAEPSYGEVTA